MKQLLFIMLVSFCLFAKGQMYTVIHSIGKIYDQSSNTYLKKGSRISESASLTFETAGARAAVLSASRGRFIIQQNAASSSQSDLAYTLSSVLSPVRGRLSTRAGGINNALDFKKHFGEGAIVVLGSGYKVAVSPDAYPMNDSKFFYVQYTYQGERINKKLAKAGDSLYFEVETMYAVDGEPIDGLNVSEVQLFYYNSEKEESTLITDLDFVLVADEEVQSINSSLEVGSVDDQNQALLEIINDLFGKCTLSYLNAYLGNN
jgi:hypothetical protein